MTRFLLALMLCACTAPNDDAEDPAELCDYDAPEVQSVFRLDGDGNPKGWTGFEDGRQIHWTRYENGDPYSVVDGAIRARCYPGRRPAELCIGDPADGCTCYLPDGDEADCETVWPIIARAASDDLRSDGAESVR